MYLRSQKAKEPVPVQTVADRVKLNPRAAAKEANEVLVSNSQEKETKKEKVVQQAVCRVSHRYMLRSMRR